MAISMLLEFTIGLDFLWPSRFLGPNCVVLLHSGSAICDIWAVFRTTCVVRCCGVMDPVNTRCQWTGVVG